MIDAKPSGPRPAPCHALIAASACGVPSTCWAAGAPGAAAVEPPADARLLFLSAGHAGSDCDRGQPDGEPTHDHRLQPAVGFALPTGRGGLRALGAAGAGPPRQPFPCAAGGGPPPPRQAVPWAGAGFPRQPCCGGGAPRQPFCGGGGPRARACTSRCAVRCRGAGRPARGRPRWRRRQRRYRCRPARPAGASPRRRRRPIPPARRRRRARRSPGRPR